MTTVHPAPLVFALLLSPPFASPALARGPRAALLAAEQARKDTGQTYSFDRVDGEIVPHLPTAPAIGRRGQGALPCAAEEIMIDK